MNSDRRNGRPGVRDFLLLAVSWVFALVVANPVGNFPLNDDWSYAPAVHRLVSTGEFRPTDWTTVTLLTHVLWGALFAKVFGFSHAVLRVSTLVASFWGVCATYLLVRSASGSRQFAMGSAWVLALGPLYLPLSATFMTDVPFTALASTTGYLYLRALRGGSAGAWVAATALAIVTTLNRQVGLAIPFALACAVALQRAGFRRLAVSAASFFATAASLAGFQAWMRSHGRTPALYNGQMVDFLSSWGSPVAHAKSLVFSLACCVLYLGWMLSPAVLASYGSAARASRLRSVCLGASAAVVVLWIHRMMPLTGNVITSWGLGPVILPGSESAKAMPSIGPWFWLPVSCLGIVCGGILGESWLRVGFGRLHESEAADSPCLEANRALGPRFLAFAGAFIVAPLAASPLFFDRYLLPSIPFLLAVVARCASESGTSIGASRRLVFFALLLPLAAFSIAATHDYFSWNRARWEGIRHLVEDLRVPPANISGGLELDTPRDHGLPAFNVRVPSEAPPGDVHYSVGLREIDGWRVIASYPCRLYLVPSQRRVWVLMRAARPE